MTTITDTFRTSKGTPVTVELTVINHRVSGTATCNGTPYSVTGYAVIQGKKVLQLVGARAPYLPIPNSLYDQIDSTCKAQFTAQMTPAQIADGKMREAEAKYNRLVNQGFDNAAIIKARDEWDRLSAKYHALNS